MPGLHEIIYVSRRSPGVTDDDVIDGIALPSVRRNRTLDITGCLWFDDERFLQLIEGPRESVEAIYAAILIDTRHEHVNLISGAPIIHRSFNRWNMKALGYTADGSITHLVNHYTARGGMPTAVGQRDDHAKPGVIVRLRGRLAGLAHTHTPVGG